MTDPHAPRKKHKGLRILLLILVIGVMGYGYFRWSVSRRLAQQIQWLESRGYPVTLEQLERWYDWPFVVTFSDEMR